MKCLHIFAYDDEQKFSTSFIKFVEDKFSKENHRFILTLKKSDTKTEIIQGNAILMHYHIKGSILLMKEIIAADKILIHGLSSNKYVYLALLLNKYKLKKCYWAVWGMGLYKYLENNNKNKELIRKIIIPKFGGIITQLRGDYDLARQWYGAKGKYYYSFMYPSNLYKEYDLKKVEKDSGKTYIQVGNSGGESNEHIEVLEKLSKYYNKNIEIICPLSYSGKEKYVKQVIEAGYKIFGKEKFSPITDFMPFDEYLKILAKVDIAIFNHKRQRGLGNITTLLGLGKKVYIREEITTWQFCTDHDLKVYSANGNYDDLFEEMDEEIKQKNIENMKKKFSEEKLVEDWRRIFDA